MIGLCKTRRVGMLAACAVSVGVGMTLVWHLVPEALRQVHTAELLAVLGLFFLPVATVFAFTMERHARRGMARVEVGPEAVEVAHGEQGDLKGADRAWEAVWAAVMSGVGGAGSPQPAPQGGGAPAPGGGAARREVAGSRRPGVDAGSRRRREDVVATGAVSAR